MLVVDEFEQGSSGSTGVTQTVVDNDMFGSSGEPDDFDSLFEDLRER